MDFLEFCLGDKKGVLENANVWKPRFLSFLEHESLSEWDDLSLDNIQPLDTNLTLELGEKTPEIIHLPGHSPGHCGLYEPVGQILFIGDIDVGSRFGPWYGWSNANLQTFRKTIVKLKEFIENNARDNISIFGQSNSNNNTFKGKTVNNNDYGFDFYNA